MHRCAKTEGHVLALDGGGSSVKASVVALADGSVVGTLTHAVSRQPSRDPSARSSILGTGGARSPRAPATAVAAAPGATVKAVVCTGMRIPFVLVDDAGAEVRPGILNHDRRGADLLDAVRAAAGPACTSAPATGRLPSSASASSPGSRATSPSNSRGRGTCCSSTTGWSSGSPGAVVSEPSSAAMSGALDLASGGWASDLLAALGVDPGLFPPLVRAGTEVGGVRPEVASAIGIAAGTPVLAGGGDTHMSCLGIGHAGPGDITVVAGSTTPVMLASADPPLDAVEQPVVSPHVFPGMWAAETNAGATGIRFTWLLGLAHELGAAGAVLRRPDTPGGIRPCGSTRPVRRRRQPVLGRGGLGLDAGGRAARPDAVPFGRGCRAGAARGLGHRSSGADRAPRADAARRGRKRARHGRSEPQPVLVPAARRRLRPPDRNGRRGRALVAGGGAGRPRRYAQALPQPGLTAYEPSARASEELEPVRAGYEERYAALAGMTA